ncbi:MAG: endonuclease/exonuclease/phosphatase family protein [Halalkalicoccus sp.]
MTVERGGSGGYGRRQVLRLGGAAFVATGVAGRAAAEADPTDDTLVFAEYNVELLTTEKIHGERSEQLEAAAEVVQRTPEPDVLAVLELDNNFQSGERTRRHNGEAFMREYLAVPQAPELEGVEYEYFYAPESNTGVPSGIDANKDGHALEQGTDFEGSDPYGEDAWGYGEYPGQYAMGIYSNYPIDVENVRTMRKLRWRDVPDNRIPTEETVEELADDEEPWGWLTDAEQRRFRVSSKTHADVPLQVGDETIHAILAHPTPPVFDGPENFNGRRNHGENKLLGDYVRGAEYVYDDAGCEGGLAEGEPFVVLGDLNTEPGDEQTFDVLDEHVFPYVNTERMPTSESGAAAGNERWTAQWEAQVDYVLPSPAFDVVDSAVFWPDPDEEPERNELATRASDHFLVWSELDLA